MFPFEKFNQHYTVRSVRRFIRTVAVQWCEIDNRLEKTQKTPTFLRICP